MALCFLKVQYDGSIIYIPNMHNDYRANLITVPEEVLTDKFEAHEIPLNRKSAGEKLDDTP